MGKDHLLYGRNILREALSCGVKIREVFCLNPSSEQLAKELLGVYGAPIRSRFPQELNRAEERQHQGIAFRVEHDFYLSSAPKDWAGYPLVLMCNHLEDAQNLGAIARSAVAFGVKLIVHEARRSVRLNAAAVKVSAGQAFRMKFLEVSNLTPFLRSLRDDGFVVVGLEKSENSIPLYEWKPEYPLGLVVGSEASGLSRPVVGGLDHLLEIPVDSSLESLNVSHATSIALSWMFANRLKAR